MPLFFFLSGMVFKEQFKSFWTLIVKSFKTILIPYLLFAALTYLFWFIKEPETHNTMQAFIYQLQGIAFGNGNNGYLYFNVALWFLPCLFITKIIFAALTRISHSNKILFSLLIVCSVIGYILSTYFNTVKLLFGLETAFSAIVFFGAGFLVKRNEQILKKLQNRGVLYFIAGLAITIILATINYNIYGNQIDMRVNRINNYFLFYAAAFSGIFCWIACSIIIGKNRLLEYIGKHTLILFVWHYLLFSYLRDFSAVVFAADILKAMQFLMPAIITAISVILILSGNILIKRMRVRITPNK
jgi:fucose 4-O-acetylase-like acetyltransferase